MKIPFFNARKKSELTFQELRELLLTNDLIKLKREKQRGLNFKITDSYDQTNLLQYYIKYQESFNYNKTDIIQFLIDCGLDINHKGDKRADDNSALHLSVLKKDLGSLQVLLNLNAKVDIQDKNGNTPLWKAVMNYRGEYEMKEIIELLIKNGALIDKKNFHNVSPKDHIQNVNGGIDAGFNNQDWDLRELL